ncbi:hypothetical protein BH11MYX1_BH11MYX1_36000 [soil metagenome]
MQDISNLALASVTGGTASSTTRSPSQTGTLGPTGPASPSAGISDGLQTSLNSIAGSIKDLSHRTNNGLFSGSNMMMFGMAMAMRNRSEVTVNYNSGGGSGHGGFSFRGRW